MKNRTYCLLITVLLLTVAGSAEAQLDRLKRRTQNNAEHKVNSRVDNKIDRTMDKGFDAVEGIFKKKNKDNAQGGTDANGNPLENLDFSIEEDNSAAQPNEFIGSFTMEVTTYKNGQPDKNSPATVSYAFDEWQSAMAINDNKGDGNTRIIFDLREKKQTMLTQDKKGKKTGVKMKMMKMKVRDNDNNIPDPKVTRTNETKQILGHTCRKYLVEDDENNTTAWVAEDIDISFEQMFQNLDFKSGGKGVSEMRKQYNMKGFPLESETVSKKKNEKSVAKFTELKIGTVDKSAFSTAGYEVTEMPDVFGGGFKGN